MPTRLRWDVAGARFVGERLGATASNRCCWAAYYGPADEIAQRDGRRLNRPAERDAELRGNPRHQPRDVVSRLASPAQLARPDRQAGKLVEQDPLETVRRVTEVADKRGKLGQPILFLDACPRSGR
jgi:hypothetical protein